MKGYRLGTAAEFDLNAIWEYIALDSIDAADRWIAKLFEAFESLAHNSGLGHRRQDLTPLPVCFWPVERYLIIYRVVGEYVEIVAVTQGSRDIPTFLIQRYS